ncbi:uncharacterized protein LOC101845818 [Aplysia californica]|uniref:Uncharacterized protein LOC101845818 n=1 Tax=Aplysia californica TaxID=6500 RepID=A0ABM0JC94_APLCA|nr:uncharacterized protein LOC101845818 [Aplysia californica]
MQTLTVFLACVALFASAHACSDDTNRLDACSQQFESDANALLPDIEAGLRSQTEICPLGWELKRCMLRVVDDFCDDVMKMILRPMVIDLMDTAMEEVGCGFMARRGTQKLVARSLALAKYGGLKK